jgi:flagellar P-ring protein FlgI
MKKLSHYFLLTTILISSLPSQAARLKDIASLRGVRENQLIGYGLVIGLKGTGDTQTDYTNKSFGRFIEKLGVKINAEQAAGKNVAAVIITAKLPPFAKAGKPLDITVSSIGDSTSLVGGTLIQSPLRVGNDQIYAVAQGAVSVLGDGKDLHTTVGRVINGAMIERDIEADFSSRKMYRMTLHNPDFTTAARTLLTINKELGGQYASAKDAGTIDIITPAAYESKGVELMATIENIEINPDQKARVVINEKTGTIVIGEKVRISKIGISHGNINLKIVDEKTKKTIASEDKATLLDTGSSVGDLVQALNKLGVTPKDLISILHSIKAAGALQGELETL